MSLHQGDDLVDVGSGVVLPPVVVTPKAGKQWFMQEGKKLTNKVLLDNFIMNILLIDGSDIYYGKLKNLLSDLFETNDGVVSIINAKGMADKFAIISTSWANQLGDFTFKTSFKCRELGLDKIIFMRPAKVMNDNGIYEDAGYIETVSMGALLPPGLNRDQFYKKFQEIFDETGSDYILKALWGTGLGYLALFNDHKIFNEANLSYIVDVVRACSSDLDALPLTDVLQYIPLYTQLRLCYEVLKSQVNRFKKSKCKKDFFKKFQHALRAVPEVVSIAGKFFKNEKDGSVKLCHYRFYAEEYGLLFDLCRSLSLLCNDTSELCDDTPDFLNTAVVIHQEHVFRPTIEVKKHGVNQGQPFVTGGHWLDKGSSLPLRPTVFYCGKYQPIETIFYPILSTPETKLRYVVPIGMQYSSFLDGKKVERCYRGKIMFPQGIRANTLLKKIIPGLFSRSIEYSLVAKEINFTNENSQVFLHRYRTGFKTRKKVCRPGEGFPIAIVIKFPSTKNVMHIESCFIAADVSDFGGIMMFDYDSEEHTSSNFFATDEFYANQFVAVNYACEKSLLLSQKKVSKTNVKAFPTKGGIAKYFQDGILMAPHIRGDRLKTQ